MQRSSDVERLVREDVAALNRSDLDAVAQGTSRDCVTIGTDPNEYARTFEENMALARESTPSATVPMEITVEELHAYEEGTVGWFDA
jgi:ketosteroid isomerase-like protein